MSGAPKDYIEVKDRLVLFFEANPTGSIQSDYELLEVGNKPTWVVTARAYRTPDDERPGVGHAKEVVPGSTPFTAGSELENCSTSAIGRALVSLGIAAHRGIASAQDVRKSQAENQRPPAKTVAARGYQKLTRGQQDLIADIAKPLAGKQLAALVHTASGSKNPTPTFEDDVEAQTWVAEVLPLFPVAGYDELVELIHGSAA
jgi:hypothetical protein